MKVISSKKMAQLESFAYRDGADETDFMEEAGSGISLVVHAYVERNELDKNVLLLCGKGNNGGDAYVAGVHLLNLGYKVAAFQIVPIAVCSDLCKKNHQRFLNEGGIVKDYVEGELIPFPPLGIILDGIFGTGFKGSPQEPFADVINQANSSNVPIISIDIPSGLNGETGEALGPVIEATETAFLALPKTGFFLQNGWNYVGKLQYVDFGLGFEYIDEAEPDLIMMTAEMIKPLMPKVKRNRHKYERGYVVGLSGSPGMPGAAVLSSWAALCGGAGIVRLLHPHGMQAELSSSPYEIIKVPYEYDKPEHLIEVLNSASAVYIGPGMGLNDKTRTLIREVLPNIIKPCVIDADALNIISEEEIILPDQVILTPHRGEMARLLGEKKEELLTMDFLKKCQDYVEKNGVTLVLKGGPTFILHPHETMFVNAGGSPGMATAGSGDVLTGMIAALLSQKIRPLHAAMLGVNLHGLAGECAALDKTVHSLMATDIINYLPEAFGFYDSIRIVYRNFDQED